MKKPGLFAASVAAASASISVSSPSTICNTTQQEDNKNKEQSSPQRPSSTDKFAPRFDGLRFIETLVTAHR
ncbi:Phospho-N-acetylmuramoyl-pentapeptide-transferase, putative [Fagus crenata]